MRAHAAQHAAAGIRSVAGTREPVQQRERACTLYHGDVDAMAHMLFTWCCHNLLRSRSTCLVNVQAHAARTVLPDSVLMTVRPVAGPCVQSSAGVWVSMLLMLSRYEHSPDLVKEQREGRLDQHDDEQWHRQQQRPAVEQERSEARQGGVLPCGCQRNLLLHSFETGAAWWSDPTQPRRCSSSSA